MNRSLQRRSTFGPLVTMLLVGLLLAVLAVPQPVRAANLTAGTFGELVTAINTANTLPDLDTITLTADILLTADLPLTITDINFEGDNHTIDGNLAHRFLNKTVGNVSINNLTVVNCLSNEASPAPLSSGGAILNSGGDLTITNSTFSGNQASSSNVIAFGGVIYNVEGKLTITDSTFSGNTASSDTSPANGGAIYTQGVTLIINSTFSNNQSVSDSNSAIGGAIYFQSSTLTISNSTFSNNQAISTSGPAAVGGALFILGFTGTSITNSTFSSNQVFTNGGSASGGAIFNPIPIGSFTITNSTFSGNQATTTGPISGAAISTPGLIDLKNSIVVGPGGVNNCAGPVTDLGHNLQFPDNSCGVTIPVTDPLLDPAGLQDNGGPTQTIALQGISPAINQVPLVDCPAADQRGVVRVNLCDIGAYEYSPTITLSPATLPDGVMNTIYSQQLSASGGTANYTFSVTTGNLPAGLTLSTSGMIFGVPTTVGPAIFTVTATDANGFTGSRQYTLTIQAPGSLSVSDQTVNEGKNGITEFSFTVSLAQPYSQIVTVAYATADGSATVATNDYLPTSGTLTFLVGEASKTVVVQVLGDTKVEENETFTLNLSNPNNGTIIKGQGIGTILNDDAVASNGPPADLIGQLRETSDRIAANDSENLIRYTFTVKNIGQGTAGSIFLTLPIDPQLVPGFTEFTGAGVWVSSVTTNTVIVSLPALSNNEVVTGTIVFRPNSTQVPVVGSSVTSRYSLKWTNPAGDDKTVLSNAISFEFGAAGSNLDVSGGQVQLMTVDAPNGSKIVYHSDFFIPNEIISTWLTRPDGTSVALTHGDASDQGQYSVEVDASGLTAGTYVVAAYGQRSEVYGSGILEVTGSGSSSAKPATNLTQKALGADRK